MRSFAALVIWLGSAAAIVSANTASMLGDGTLLFLENCSSVVERTTHGEIAHVALVFREGGQTWIYEATPAKVRRVVVDAYFAELARLNERRNDGDRIRVLAVRPKVAYAEAETKKMRSYLDQQLGRRYSVKNYVRGKPYDGIHCAELASSTLNQSGRYDFADCHKLNPQALYTAVLPTHAGPEAISIPSLVTQEPWRLRMQRSWLAWFTWCRWSCREAWLFCW
jgi:hypothetical protein